MALTAKFTADFSQFESAIKGAAVTVTTFEKGVKSAASDLSKLASSLSGAEIQRQAATATAAIESIGGATKLTAAEAAKMAGPIDQAIAKYKALGQEVPPELEKVSKELQEVQAQAKKTGDSSGGIGSKFKSELAGIGGMVAGAFTVGALIDFGKGMLDLGGKITDTSNKLGISTDAVQEFEYAASATGSSIETFSGAMSKMQNSLVEGSKGTVEAIGKLNLSFDKLQKMAPDEAFTAIADAIKGVQDPMEQTQLAMELFGKAGVEMLPAIREGMGDLRAAAHDANQVISKEGIKALDDFGDMAAETYKRMQVGAAQMAIGIINSLKDIENGFKQMGGNARADWDRQLDELDKRLKESKYNQDRLLAAEVIKPPPLPAPPAGFGKAVADTTALADGYKRVNDLVDAKIEADKQAASAAKAHAEAVKALRDQLSGAALQADIKKLAQAWDGLSKAQKENDTVLKRILPTLEDYVREGGKLPPILQKLYDDHQRANTAVANLTGGFSKALPILNQYAQGLDKPADALKSLRLDGLLPAIPLTEKFGTVLEASGNKSKDVAGQFKQAADAAAELARQAGALKAADFGAGLASSLFEGFKSEGLTGAIRGVGDFLASEMVGAMQAGIEEKIKSGDLGLAGAFGSGIGAIAIGFIAQTWVDMLISAITADENYRQAREAGETLGSEFVKGFGGPRAFRDMAELAGASQVQISKAMDGTAESVEEGILQITPLINRYQQVLAGLGTAAGGTNQMAEGLAAQFAPAIAEQKRALEESQRAMLDYEKANGASAERIAELQKKFAKDAEGQVFTATAENIDRVNALGTIIGGVIANTAGRTGDLVGAINAVGPALDQISKMREQFALTGEQISPATAEVLKLYDTVRANEDVFSIVQGLGQVMTGLGDALISNSALANTFGGELAAQFTILTDRGVDAHVALAAMAPSLQELWELSQQGKITVDETTQALLNQAEAQGIVGQSMKDANEQILDVLTEIRDLFADSLPGAIARTGSTAEAASGQINRGIRTNVQSAEQLHAALGPQMGIAARTGQLAVLDSTNKEEAALLRAKQEAERLNRAIGPGMMEAARTANEAIDTISRRSITIPINFDVEQPYLPELPDYSETPTQPGDAGTANSYSQQQSYGTTEVNFNVDGNTLARIVAPKIPGVVNGYVVD